MPLFWKPYTSDVTDFIDELKAKKPTLEDEQRQGRSIFWDRRIDRTAEAEYDEARVRAAGLRLPAAARAERSPRADEWTKLLAEPEVDVVDSIAVARLYGEPLFDLPQDLYIPPDALEVFLEAFEGPLDLLLYLIRRQNFNILDIPLASVTRQYLAYVEQIRTRNLELAADYLLMAAMLIEIKSRMLLPPRKSADGKEPDDPRAELVRRLIEYEQMKLAAAKLDALPLLGRDFARAHVAIDEAVAARLPVVATADLRDAWLEIAKRARLNQHHLISREHLSVREHMSIVLRALQGRRFAVFEDLFDARARRSGRGRHLHRPARARARAPARGDAGGGVRADLRQARVPAVLSAATRARLSPLPGSAVRRGRGRPQAGPSAPIWRPRRRR